MIELACDEAVFHFNKGHLADSAIPMWVVKAKGKTFYINHMDCTVPWSTKETPDNPATKGSIKVKKCLLTIDDNNCATLAPLTDKDIRRLKRKELGIVRVITKAGELLKDALANLEIDHSPIKRIAGTCTSTFYITDIMKQGDWSMLLLSLGGRIRELMPNESYFRAYDDAGTAETINVDDYEFGDDDLDNED